MIMGWDMDIVANKKILEKDIDTIIKKLPEELHHSFGTSKQSWGWSCAVDVNLPVRKKLGLHGAQYSAHMIEPFSDYMCNALKKKGYQCKKTEVSW